MLTGQFLELAKSISTGETASDIVKVTCPAKTGNSASGSMNATVDLYLRKVDDYYRLIGYGHFSQSSPNAVNVITVEFPNLPIVVSSPVQAQYSSIPLKGDAPASVVNLIINVVDATRRWYSVSTATRTEYGAERSSYHNIHDGMVCPFDAIEVELDRRLVAIYPKYDSQLGAVFRGVHVDDGVFTRDSSANNRFFSYLERNVLEDLGSALRPITGCVAMHGDLFLNIMGSESGAFVISFSDFCNPGQNDTSAPWFDYSFLMSMAYAYHGVSDGHGQGLDLTPGHVLALFKATGYQYNNQTPIICKMHLSEMDTTCLGKAGITCTSIETNTLQYSALAMTFVGLDGNVIQLYGKYRAIRLM